MLSASGWFAFDWNATCFSLFVYIYANSFVFICLFIIFGGNIGHSDKATEVAYIRGEGLKLKLGSVTLTLTRILACPESYSVFMEKYVPCKQDFEEEVNKHGGDVSTVTDSGAWKDICRYYSMVSTHRNQKSIYNIWNCPLKKWRV